ncbi:MAG: ABC transporter permease [Deltaproteobacteria bacterium]|nr:MAG: ABC transporter permease [Deltaproteobacteria bacterium]
MKNRFAIIGLVVVIIFALTAIFAPILAPYDPNQQELREGFGSPRQGHLLGQDRLGRDILSRIIFGSRVSVLVGISTVSISLLLGLTIGSLAGYYGGAIDELFMRVIDILLAFPGILLAIFMTAILGPSLRNVILALCVLGWVGYARIVRGQFLSVREREYTLSVKALGASDLRVILRHIIPNILSPVIVEATFGMAAVILAEASLSFLGLGTQGMPSWGAMLSEGAEFLEVAPHLSTFPGCAIILIVLGFNFLGDGLRDWLDPKKVVVSRLS